MHADEELLGPKDRREWEKKADDYVESSNDPAKWKRPPSTKDKLIDAPAGKGPVTAHPKDRLRRSGVPRVFHGRIGASNVVLADPVRRDYLRDNLGIKAVAMEDSGIADASWVATTGYLVVRGTCDYCNSNKNDDWHHYAALIAAAYARTVVEYLHPQPLTVPESAGSTALPAMLECSTHSSTTAAEVPVNQSSLPGTVQTAQVPPEQQGASQHVRTQPVSTQSLQGSVEPLSAARSPEISERMGQSVVLDLIQSDRLQSLVDQIERLLKAGRFKDCAAPSGELERLLNSLPRRGNPVRSGWIMLGRLEAQRLHAAKQNNREIDVSRLRSLYKEAENVID